MGGGYRIPVPDDERYSPMLDEPDQGQLIDEQLVIVGYEVGPIRDSPGCSAPTAFYERYLADETDECKPWPFGFHPKYGTLKIDGRKRIVSKAACEWKWGPKPQPKWVAAHSCRNLVRCWNWAHLEWKSQQENCSTDMYRDGTMVVGEKRWNSKLTEAIVTDIRAKMATGERGMGSELARTYGLSPSHVHSIAQRKYWKHIP